jgi:parvulin-like peptidyl-prolyl isomerase
VLLGLVTLGLLGGFGFFSPKAEDEPSAADVPSTADSAVEPETKRPEPGPERPAKQQEAEEEIRASHLLVAYKGAQRARPDVTRTKEEAKKRAEDAMKKAKAPGADFAKIVGEYSDEPGAAQRGGDLRKFSRRRMVKPFSDAAFKLKVDEISEVVETGFGFHVIKRTE